MVQDLVVLDDLMAHKDSMVPRDSMVHPDSMVQETHVTIVRLVVEVPDQEVALRTRCEVVSPLGLGKTDRLALADHPLVVGLVAVGVAVVVVDDFNFKVLNLLTAL